MNGPLPKPRHDGESAIPVMIKVYIMTRRLIDDRKPSSVRIDRRFSNKRDIFLIKTNHGRGQGKYGQAVYPLVGKESPAGGTQSYKHDNEGQRKNFHKF